MRHAKCITDLHITVRGTHTSVAIGYGWQGDLDTVIGETVTPARLVDGETVEPEQRKAVTIADALGHHLTETNFEVLEAPGRKGPRHSSPAAAADQE